MFNSVALKSSIEKSPLRQFSAQRPDAFGRFVLSLRVKAGPRGDLIAILKTIINSHARPPVTCWADLYRVLANRGDEALMEGRKLWSQFKETQPAVSPAKSRRQHS
jgi:hypothetical protein